MCDLEERETRVLAECIMGREQSVAFCSCTLLRCGQHSPARVMTHSILKELSQLYILGKKSSFAVIITKFAPQIGWWYFTFSVSHTLGLLEPNTHSFLVRSCDTISTTITAPQEFGILNNTVLYSEDISTTERPILCNSKWMVEIDNVAGTIQVHRDVYGRDPATLCLPNKPWWVLQSRYTATDRNIGEYNELSLWGTSQGKCVYARIDLSQSYRTKSLVTTYTLCERLPPGCMTPPTYFFGSPDGGALIAWPHREQVTFLNVRTGTQSVIQHGGRFFAVDGCNFAFSPPEMPEGTNYELHNTLTGEITHRTLCGRILASGGGLLFVLAKPQLIAIDGSSGAIAITWSSGILQQFITVGTI
ncbi:hypothetical protein Pelo_4175 [Pelomyxa schiedti]|nr:hypothetical protein Pelo_4175 [Pelomyxa schiedti]